MSQSYGDELKTTFGRLIDGTDLGDRERQFLKLRWLDQVLWMESKAGQAQRWWSHSISSLNNGSWRVRGR